MRSTAQILFTVLNVIGSTVTIFVAVRSWYPEASPDAKPAILFLIVLCIALVITLLCLHATYIRRSRYGSAVPALNDIYTDLFRLVSRGVVPASAEIRVTCQHIVDHLSDILSQVTGRRCAVCVKLITAEEHPSQFRARTLWRSQNSRDREKQSKRIEHWLDKNTDFEELFAERRRYFFSNWLPGIKDYKNSSFEAYGPPGSNVISRHLRWPLPYRSTIVCAIRPKPMVPEDEEATQNLIGYLCVDARRSMTFSEDDDVDLVQGVAESLYPVIRFMKESSRR